MTLRAWEGISRLQGHFAQTPLVSRLPVDWGGKADHCSLQQDGCPANGGGTGYCAQMKDTGDGRQAALEQESNPDPGLGTSNCNRPDRHPQMSTWIVWVESCKVFPQGPALWWAVRPAGQRLGFPASGQEPISHGKGVCSDL